MMPSARTRTVGVKQTGRDLVVGDVHGRFSTLDRSLKADWRRAALKDHPRILTGDFVRRRDLAPGKYFDADGLYSRVRESGRKHWEHRFRVDGKLRTMGFGPHLILSLEDARNRVRLNLVQICEGKNPIPERRMEPLMQAWADYVDESARNPTDAGAESDCSSKSISGPCRVFPLITLSPQPVVPYSRSRSLQPQSHPFGGCILRATSSLARTRRSFAAVFLEQVPKADKCYEKCSVVVVGKTGITQVEQQYTHRENRRSSPLGPDRELSFSGCRALRLSNLQLEHAGKSPVAEKTRPPAPTLIEETAIVIKHRRARCSKPKTEKMRMCTFEAPIFSAPAFLAHNEIADRALAKPGVDTSRVHLFAVSDLINRRPCTEGVVLLPSTTPVPGVEST